MCSLPLYRETKDKIQYNLQANAGLYFDKFCDGWQKEKEIWKLGNNKQNWLKSFIDKGSVGSKELVEEKKERFIDLITGIQGSLLFVKNRERFVTGLGGNHPLETGFVWEHNLGVPYLPGTSLKGLVRSWAISWEQANTGDIKRIFGSDQQGGQAAVGSVIFFAMLPVEPVKLAVDIMTPHYSEYYQNAAKGNNPPADWYSPNPIPFLTVAVEQDFITGIAPRCCGNLRHQTDISIVKEWMIQALAVMGAGAKTAVGYGRFDVNEQAQLKWEKTMREKEQIQRKALAQQAEQERLAVLPPLEREMEENGYSLGEGFPVKTWVEKMGVAAPADKLIIARKLAAWYQKNKLPDWEKPKKKSKNYDYVSKIKAVLQEAGI